MTRPVCAVCKRPAEWGSVLRVVPTNGERDWYCHRPGAAPCFARVPCRAVALIEVDQGEADRWDRAQGGVTTWAADAATARRAHDVARQVGGYQRTGGDPLDLRI